MKIWVFKILGREILRLENHEEATVDDVVRAMLAQRLSGGSADDEEELIECKCCGEMFDPEEVEAQALIDDEFEDIAGNLAWGERIVWDVRTSDEEEE